MTEAEFKTWLGDVQKRFPESFRWFLSRHEGEHDSDWRDRQKATNRTWWECLGDLELADCQAAALQVHRGESDWNGKMDFLPQVIRSLARRRSADREHRDRQRSYEGRPRTHAAISGLSAALAEILTMRESGRSEDDIKQFLESKFQRPKGDTSGPRFRCLSCEDTGWQYVASNRLIAHIRDGGSSATYKGPPTCVVLCQCGRIKRKEAEAGKQNDLVFSIQHFCPLPKNPTAEQIDADARDWLKLYQSPATRGNQVLAGWNKE
jgi:hypothetical protein